MTKILAGQVWKPGDLVNETVTVLEVTGNRVHYKWDNHPHLKGVRSITAFSNEWQLVPDESLPDTPEEVMYFPDGDDKEFRILIRQIKPGVLIGSKVHDKATWQLLDADTALQLSHDLLRMGLALKRKQG